MIAQQKPKIMNARQIQLVKESWGYVIVKSDEAGQLFYTRLFETAPSVKHMFKTDTKDQARKLMSMVTLIVSKLDKLDVIIAEIKSLATRHNKYGTKKEHYAAVGDSLLWTLRTGLGNRWNEETEEAWLAVYKILSESMIETQFAAA
jgi:hemoglobin-like flavoprotein